MNHKYAAGQAVFHWFLMAFSCSFWIAAKLTDEAVMPVEVYGDPVVLYKAETWALAQILVSTLVLFGVYRNGRAWFTPYARLIGNFSGFLVYGFFSYSAATSAAFPEAVTLAALFIVAMPCLFYAGVSFLDCLRKPENGFR